MLLTSLKRPQRHVLPIPYCHVFRDSLRGTAVRGTAVLGRQSMLLQWQNMVLCTVKYYRPTSDCFLDFMKGYPFRVGFKPPDPPDKYSPAPWRLYATNKLLPLSENFFWPRHYRTIMFDGFHLSLSNNTISRVANLWSILTWFKISMKPGSLDNSTRLSHVTSVIHLAGFGGTAFRSSAAPPRHQHKHTTCMLTFSFDFFVFY